MWGEEWDGEKERRKREIEREGRGKKILIP